MPAHEIGELTIEGSDPIRILNELRRPPPGRLAPIGRSVPNPVVHAPTVCWTPTTQVVEAIPHR